MKEPLKESKQYHNDWKFWIYQTKALEIKNVNLVLITYIYVKI